MSQHTKEPWKQSITDSDGYWIDTGDKYVARAYKKEDAKRIVACVNACAGISTASLLEIDELNKANVHLFDIINAKTKAEAQLTAQRELNKELVDALKELEANYERLGWGYNQELRDKHKALIAKAEEMG